MNSMAMGRGEVGEGVGSVNHGSESYSKRLCVTSLAVTCFLRMLPSSCLLPVFSMLSVSVWFN